jgi:hypothetical protein
MFQSASIPADRPLTGNRKEWQMPKHFTRAPPAAPARHVCKWEELSIFLTYTGVPRIVSEMKPAVRLNSRSRLSLRHWLTQSWVTEDPEGVCAAERDDEFGRKDPEKPRQFHPIPAETRRGRMRNRGQNEVHLI